MHVVFMGPPCTVGLAAGLQRRGLAAACLLQAAQRKVAVFPTRKDLR